jgi:predicted acetyltransferase
MVLRSLCAPAVYYAPSYIAALREEYHLGDDPALSPGAIDAISGDFAAHVDRANRQGTLHVFPDGSSAPLSPFSLFWFVENDSEFLGSLHLRHELANDYARVFAGHVRYGIRPIRRNQGLGTEMLRLAIPRARAIGHQRILVVCREGNMASRRLIEKCGGVLENIVEDPFGEGPKRRYWITL